MSSLDPSSRTSELDSLLLYPRLVFDPAFLGWAQRPGDPSPIAIYDFNACVQGAQTWFDLSPEDALDYVSTQCVGTWLGPGSPLLVHLSPTPDQGPLP